MTNPDAVVVFGAGNIGRGLVARLVGGAGLRPVLVEADVALCRRLREAGRYGIRFVGERRRDVEVADYGVVAATDAAAVAQALATCAFAVTAVGGSHLAEVAGPLAAGAAGRPGPLNVVVCENIARGDAVLRAALEHAGASGGRVACVRASVERIVRGVPGSLDLIAEDGQVLHVDRSAWVGDPPAVPGLHFCDDLEPEYARKLFTSNAGHAVLAYLGAPLGCEFVHEAMAVPGIRWHLKRVLGLAGRALMLRYGIDKSQMGKHLHTLVTHRYPNRELADPVKRVAREPLRKLGPEERLVGLVRLLEACGLPTEPVCRVIGAALHYFDPEDPQCVALRERLEAEGAAGVLESVCGFGRDEPCFAESLAAYARQ